MNATTVAVDLAKTVMAAVGGMTAFRDGRHLATWLCLNPARVEYRLRRGSPRPRV